MSDPGAGALAGASVLGGELVIADRRIWWLSSTSGEVAGGDGWLAPGEQLLQQGLRMPRRRDDWRLGRWVAKQAVARWRATLAPADLPPAPAEIEVLARPGGAPRVEIRGAPGPEVSITHTHGRGVAAVTADDRLGVDLERVETRAQVFVTDWFTPAEVAAVDGAGRDRRDQAVTLTWSAKEAALKAIGEGLRLDTREVEVRAGGLGDDAPRWRPVEVVWSRPGRRFVGRWRRAGPDVLVIVTEDPAARP